MEVMKIWRRKYRRFEYYNIFTEEEAQKEGIDYKPWREGQVGDWVLTDDGYVVQVIATYGKKGGIVRTPGCTAVRKAPDSEMVKKTPNPSIIGGRLPLHVEKITVKHKAFVDAYLATFNPIEAYWMVYGRKSYKYTRNRIEYLMASPKIKELINMGIKDMAKTCGIDEEYVLQNMKNIQESTPNEFLKANILKEFARMLGMYDQPKVKESYTEEVEAIDMEQIKKIKGKRVRELEAPSSNTVVFGNIGEAPKALVDKGGDTGEQSG